MDFEQIKDVSAKYLKSPLPLPVTIVQYRVWLSYKSWNSFWQRTPLRQTLPSAGLLAQCCGTHLSRSLSFNKVPRKLTTTKTYRSGYHGYDNRACLLECKPRAPVSYVSLAFLERDEAYRMKRMTDVSVTKLTSFSIHVR